jgi:hypothetical protein
LIPLLRQSGWLTVAKLSVSSLESEEVLVLAGVTDHGESLDAELCSKLLALPARQSPLMSEPPMDFLDQLQAANIQVFLREVAERNGRHFDEQVAKLDRWSEDLKFGLEREIKDLDKAIREARRASALAGALRDKLDAQKSIKNFEAARSRKRKELFDSQDKIDQQRDELIAQIEQQMEQRHSARRLFTIRWTLAG